MFTVQWRPLMQPLLANPWHVTRASLRDYFQTSNCFTSSLYQTFFSKIADTNPTTRLNHVQQKQQQLRDFCKCWGEPRFGSFLQFAYVCRSTLVSLLYSKHQLAFHPFTCEEQKSLWEDYGGGRRGCNFQIVPSPSSLLHFGPRSFPQLPCSASTMTFRHYQDSPALAAEAD